MFKTTTNPTQVDLKDTLGKNPTIHQVTSTDDPSLAGGWAIIKVLGHQYRWLAWWLWPGKDIFRSG